MVVGLAAVVAAAVLSLAGGLDIVERRTVDATARWFDRFSQPVSDEIVIAGIDDRALREVQSWPWDRVYLAQAIDELTRGGAKTIALDVLLEESQPPRPTPGDDVKSPRLGMVSGDEELARAISRHGSVVVPIRFTTRRGEADHAVQAEEAGRAEHRGRVFAAQRDRSYVPHDDSTMFWLPTFDLGGLPIEEVGTTAARLGDVSLSAADADDAVRSVSPVAWYGGVWGNFAVMASLLHRGGRFVPSGDLSGDIRVTPVGTKDVWTSKTVWRVPTTPLTWPRGGSHFIGQFTSDPARPQEISLAAVMQPALIRRSAVSNLLTIADLLEKSRDVGLEPSAEAATLARSLSRDVAGQPDSITDGLYLASLQRLNELCGPVVKSAKEFLEFLSSTDDGATTPSSDGGASKVEPPAAESAEDAARVKLFRAVAETLAALLVACESAPAEISKSRKNLHPIVEGKLVFIGWTGTGDAAADTVPTSIHPQTPGVYVHAAVANMMLTGFMRQRVGWLFDLVVMLVIGVVSVLLAVRLPLGATPLALVVLVVGWFFVCGIGLWDYGRLIVSCTGPMGTASAGWLAVFLHRGLIEQRDRRRTVEQFRAYVSPEVVDVLVENPELRSLSPQKRELTVLMADLEGFTALAERLGEERTGRVLGAYLRAMTEVLLRHGATIDKYLGDGIMAFWGAPIEMAPSRQATSACAAAIEMQRRLAEMNARGEFGPAHAPRGDSAPSNTATEELRLRIGISAGSLMVGDFGCPPTRSSYTVIGDAANLAARLQEACKLLGVRVLVSDTVRRLATESTMKFRLVQRLRLRGREQEEDVYSIEGEV